MHLLIQFLCYILASYSLITNYEEWSAKYFVKDTTEIDDNQVEDIFITHLQLSFKQDLRTSSLCAQHALITPQGLKMSFVEGQIYEKNKLVEIRANEAFWPFNQKIVYFFEKFIMSDNDLLMNTSAFSYNFGENTCLSHAPTYWKTKDMTMISHEMQQPADELKRIFLGSS